MKYKHILITGGAGFIGSHLADYLIEKKYQIRILDNLHPQIHPDGKIPSYVNKNAEFIKGDVTKRADWQKALHGIDAVIHFAAAVGVGQSMYQIGRYVTDNCLGTALLLDIIANEPHTVKKIIVAASMSSFGEGMYVCSNCGSLQQPPIRKIEDMKMGIWEPLCITCKSRLVAKPTNETARLLSPSVYAITKKAQEELVLSVGRSYKIPAVSLRFFNAYGPRQSLSNPYNGVAAIFLSRIKNNKPPIINEDGLQTRDFIHIRDIVKVVELALTKNEANYEFFNVGSGTATTILDVAKIALSLYKSNLRSEITGKFRSFDVRHCYADTTKLRCLLGWEPTITFEQGMREVFEWSKTQEANDLVEQSLTELTKRGLR